MAVLSRWSDLSVNSVNERDLSLLTSDALLWRVARFLEGLFVFNEWKFEAITGL